MAVTWRDAAIVLTAPRPLGESGRLIRVLTRERGVHAGVIRGRAAERASQPGTLAEITWRARLPDQLGSFTVEAAETPLGRLLDDRLALAALSSALAVADALLPEREACPAVFEALGALIGLLGQPHWDAAHVRWEVGVLAALGFGLDLERCAVSGAPDRPNDRLAYVSPRTGRAVSLSAGEPYRDRLLPLPGFLAGRDDSGPAAVLDGLALTGHFLERFALGQAHKPMPPARTRYVDAYRRQAAAAIPSDGFETP